jgi:hypothetical protein
LPLVVDEVQLLVEVPTATQKVVYSAKLPEVPVTFI